jgi:hypothetical protein
MAGVCDQSVPRRATVRKLAALAALVVALASGCGGAADRAPPPGLAPGAKVTVSYSGGLDGYYEVKEVKGNWVRVNWLKENREAWVNFDNVGWYELGEKK